MGTRLVRYQIMAFILVTAVGISYAMTQYVGLERIMGIGQFHVIVQMPDTGGLYAGADVTENGVTVGKVASVSVHGHGIRTDISLDAGTQISADGLKAVVQNTSAVGEQYLQLTPGRHGEPYLRQGSVVPASAVSLPPSPTQLLGNVNALLRSVPRQQLDITVNELYKAFNGGGPQLRQLLASAGNLLSAARQNITPTKSLISGLQPVLRTQAANSASIKAFSRDLASLSAQLSASDPDLAGAIAQAPGFTTALDALVGQIQPTVPLLLANLTSLGQVLNVYLPGVRQILVILPAALDNVDAATMDSGIPGATNVDFAATFNNPPACQQGYHTPVRDPYDTTRLPPPAQEPHCDVPASSSTDVRGDRNDPCPNNPDRRAATAAGCGLYFGDTARASGSGRGSAAGDSAGTYDPASGLFVGPDGILYSAGAESITGQGPGTLSGLLRQTLGG